MVSSDHHKAIHGSRVMNRFLDQKIKVSDQPLSAAELESLRKMKEMSPIFLENGKKRKMTPEQLERYGKKMQSAVSY